MPYNQVDVLTADDDYAHVVPQSSVNRGMRRERYSNIVRYRVGDDFSVVIPPMRKGYSREARKEKAAAFKAFRKVILGDRTSISAAKNDDYWKDHLLKREVLRDGRIYYEFHVTLTSYPERKTFDDYDLSRTLVSNAIKFGVGLNVKLVDCQKPKKVLMKFKYLPYIQIYRAGDNDASALSDEISFPRSNKEATLVTTLVKELHQSKGDSFAYVEILMKYYQQRTVAAKKEITALTKKYLRRTRRIHTLMRILRIQ